MSAESDVPAKREIGTLSWREGVALDGGPMKYDNSMNLFPLCQVQEMPNDYQNPTG